MPPFQRISNTFNKERKSQTYDDFIKQVVEPIETPYPTVIQSHRGPVDVVVTPTDVSAAEQLAVNALTRTLHDVSKRKAGVLDGGKPKRVKTKNGVFGTSKSGTGHEAEYKLSADSERKGAELAIADSKRATKTLDQTKKLLDEFQAYKEKKEKAKLLHWKVSAKESTADVNNLLRMFLPKCGIISKNDPATMAKKRNLLEKLQPPLSAAVVTAKVEELEQKVLELEKATRDVKNPSNGAATDRNRSLITDDGSSEDEESVGGDSMTVDDDCGMMEIEDSDDDPDYVDANRYCSEDTVDAALLCKGDLDTLKKNECVNDACINAALHLVTEKDADVHAESSFFYTTLVTNGWNEVRKYFCPRHDDYESDDDPDDPYPRVGGDDYATSLMSTEPINPGDVVEYYTHVFVAGDKRGYRTATVLSVDPKRNPMLVLDNGEVLSPDARVRRKKELIGGMLHDSRGMYRDICNFALTTNVPAGAGVEGSHADTRATASH